MAVRPPPSGLVLPPPQHTHMQVTGVLLQRYDVLYHPGDTAACMYVVAEGHMVLYDVRSKEKEEKDGGWG